MTRASRPNTDHSVEDLRHLNLVQGGDQVAVVGGDNKVSIRTVTVGDRVGTLVRICDSELPRTFTGKGLRRNRGASFDVDLSWCL